MAASSLWYRVSCAGCSWTRRKVQRSVRCSVRWWLLGAGRVGSARLGCLSVAAAGWSWAGALWRGLAWTVTGFSNENRAKSNNSIETGTNSDRKNKIRMHGLCLSLRHYLHRNLKVITRLIDGLPSIFIIQIIHLHRSILMLTHAMYLYVRVHRLSTRVDGSLAQCTFAVSLSRLGG